MAIQALLVILAVLLVLLFLGVPISYAIAVSSLTAILSSIDLNVAVLTAAQRTFVGMSKFSLTAIPFFILAGNIMNQGGIAKRLVDFVMAILGKLPGALLVTNIGTNALFGAISGSASAAAAAVGSMMSELGRETVSAYAAAKGGLKMLTKNIASEYGAYNIQCNGIGPGYIATPQTAPLREIQPDGSRHPFDQFIVAKTPAGRWGEAEDLGGPAVFLASEASDFVNGLILYVDGGILAYIGKQPQ